MSKPETLKEKMRNGGYGTDDSYTYSSRNNSIGSYNGTYSRDVDTLKKRASSYTIDSTYEEEKKKREEQRKKDMQAHAEAMRKAPSVDSYAAQKTQANLKAPAYNSEPVSNIPSVEDYVKSKQKVAPTPMTEQEFERRKGANGGTLSVRGKAYSNYEDYVDSIENPDYENMVNRYNQAKADTNKAAVDVAKKAVTGTGTEADAQAYLDAKEREKALKRDIEYTGASIREAKNFAERQHQDRKFEKTAEEYGRLDESTIKLLDDVNEAESATDSSAASYFAGAMTGSALGNIDLTDYTHSEAYAKLSEMGYNKEQIDALRRYRSAELNAEETKQRQQKINDMYDVADDIKDEHPVIGSVLNGAEQTVGTIASWASDVFSPVGFIETIKAKETDTKVDKNSKWFIPANLTEELQEGVTSRHDWIVGEDENGNGGIDIFDEAYGLVNSTANTVIAGALTPNLGIEAGAGSGFLKRQGVKAANGLAGSLGVIGLESATQNMKELSESGAGTDQAIAGGLAAGLFEGLFESFSIGEFKSLQELGKPGVLNWLADLAKQAGVNASEEALTEVANIVYDTLANDNLSDYQEKMNEYMQSGMSEEEAKSQVIKDFALQIANAAKGGAFQALLMGGVATVGNYDSDTKRGKEINRNLAASQLYETVKKNYSGNKNSYSYKQAEKLSQMASEGKKVSNRQIGALQRIATNETFNAEEPKASKKKVKKAIESKLEEKGQVTENSDKIASAVSKVLNGESLSKAEKETIKGSKAAVEYINENESERAVKDIESYVRAIEIAGVGREGPRQSDTKSRIEYTNPEVQVGDKTVRIDGDNIADGYIYHFGAVSADEDGNNIIKLADGNTAKLSELKFKDSESNIAKIYKKADELTPAMANILIDQYDGQPVSEYTKAFDNLRTLGSLGTDATTMAYTENSPADYFDSSVVAEIMKGGLQSREFKPGLTNFATNQENIARNKRSIEIINEIGKRLGIEFYLFDSLNKDGVSHYNGAFLKDTNKIMLSLDADGGLLLRTSAHEMGHFLSNNNKAGFNRLADFVIAALRKKDVQLADKLQGYKDDGYTDEGAFEDLICDSLFKVFDGDFIRDLVKNNKNVAEAMGDTLDEFVAETEAALSSYSSGTKHAEITALNDDLDTLKEVRDIFNEELGTAVESYKTKQRAAGKTDDAGISLSAKDDVANLKKMGYNQYRSTKLAFEHGNAVTGTQIMLYNPQKNQFEIWEKGDDTIVSMGMAKPGKEAERLYERIYGKETHGVRGDTERFRNSKGQDIWDNMFSQDRTNGRGNSGQTGSKRFQSNASGSGSNLLEGNNGKSIINEPSSNDGGFSMPDNINLSTKDNTEETEIERLINTSMTMETAKGMIQRSFNDGQILDWYDGEYRNGEEWLKGVGVNDVAEMIENTYEIYEKYLGNLENYGDDYDIYDIVQAYVDGTLRGKDKKKNTPIDISKETGVVDSRFFSPKNIENAKSQFEIAKQRVTNSNRQDVYKARAQILFFAHEKGSAEMLGISNSELNKLLKSWGNYSAKSRELSQRINNGASVSNRWTGIENMSILNQVTVTSEEIKSLLHKVEGNPSDYETNYIGRTMLALDTHIDWRGLDVKFARNSELKADYGTGASSGLRGFYRSSKRLVEVDRSYGFTVAHEMGHALDHIWGREISGKDEYLTTVIKHGYLQNGLSEEEKNWVNNFSSFIDDISNSTDLHSSYTQKDVETFARFVERFVAWAEVQGTNRNYYYNSGSGYNDRFNSSQFVQFARLLQEKSSLNIDGRNNISLSTKDTTDTADKLFTLNREISALRRQIDDIKQSDEYEAAITQGDDGLDAFVKRYGDYLNSSGLGKLSERLASKEAEYKKLQEQADKEYADAASAKEAEAIAKSGGDRTEYFRKSAVKEFGYTPYFYDAGYLLPNGKMLNFSGEKGKHFGTRGEDHRGIGIIYENLQGSDAMTDFMNMGNIRIMAESPGIDISTATDITPQQYSMISKFIRDTAQKHGFFSVDFSDENGRSAGNYTYEDNINPTKIVNDIKYFFENGRTREQSITSQFHYSIKDDIIDDNGNHYGKGVYLDSDALDGLSETERIAKCKDIIRNLGGRSFTAYDNSGNEVKIQIADKVRFTNSKGIKVPANKDLREKYIKSENKQNAIVLVDELIETAEFYGTQASRKSHGWLDNYGKNDWEYWNVILQDKNNTVWRATLNVANTKNGEKILYDINPIEKAGQSVKSDTSTAYIDTTTPSSESQDNSLNGIKLSTKDQATDVQRYYEDVIKENRQLQNILSNLDFDTDTLRSSYSLDPQEVNKLANKILRENYSKDENFSKALNTVFDYMLQGEKTGRLDTDAAVQYLMQACTTMLEKSERIDDEAYEETKSIREYLRKVGVTVPENDWNNLVSEFGDAQSFQRATFGRLKVRKGTDFRNDALNGKSGSVKNIDFGNKAEALPVDTLYQELSEEYPGYFDDTIINKYDQVKAIVHFIESTKKKVYQPFGEPVKYTGGLKDFSISARQGEDQMYLEQKAADVAMQLMSEYQKLTRVYTDKQKNELYRREVDEKYRNFKRNFLQSEREKNRQLLSKKKEDVFQWYNTRLNQYKEGRENTEIRRKLNNSIDRAWNYLNTRLEEKSKSKHIPDGFDGLVRDVLKAIPGGVGNDRYAYFNRAALTNLASTYRTKALEVYGTDEKGNASNEDVAELISDFDEFIKSVADNEAPPMRRKDLNTVQVRILNNLISNVKHLVDRQNKLFGEGRQEDINELSQSVLDDYRGKDESIFQRGSDERKAKLLDLADDFRSGLTKPEYLFKESGSKALYDLYKDVRRGENAEGRVIYDAKEFLVNTKAKYNYDPAWETRTVDVPVLNANSVKITQQDAMYIYALSRRKQGRMHLIGDADWNIMGGGIRVTNAVTGKKVDVKLTPQALVHIESQLNDNQRNYVQAVVEYLSKDVAKSRNKTSMEIMGFEKYGETNYIPIRVYKGTLQQNANRPESLGTIANQGASKTLKKKAVNAIDVSGFDDVVSDHIYQSALYCGYATATENFNRVWNNKTDDGERVHGVVEKYLGKNITEYMHNFMVDVNSGQITAKQMALPNRLMGYAKKAATMANISVVVQQPTAVFRAMLYIEPKYFATVASKSDLEEMYKYNGCALKKDIGYFDVNVGKSVTDWLNDYTPDDAVKGEWSNAEKWKQFDIGGKIEDLAGWGANKADEITWGAIWNACKNKVAAEQNLSGDALIEKASELFQDTVALTQVYDSVFTKCDYMRRKEGLAQMATAFMSEPITSLNMLMDAKRQIRDAKTDEQKRKARGFTVRAFACFAAATVANAMCKSFIQVLRDDDEEKDFLVKYLTKVVSNIFGDVTGMVPYISDIISMLQGYDPTRLDTQALSKTVSTLQYISKQIKSDDPDYEKIISNSFNMVAQWTGYPVYNVYRDSKAVVDKSTSMIKRLKTKAPQVEFTGRDLANSLEEEFEFLPGVSAKVDYSKYVDDYLAGKTDKVKKQAADIDDDKITQVTSAIGKKYRAGKISRTQAKNALMVLSGKSSKESDTYIKSQDTRMKKESE